jgi:acyl carrier protein
MQAKIEKELRGFVDENFLFGQGAQSLGGDDSFLEKGIIDSTGVLELVNFIEQKYGIKVADEELVPENLDSVNCLKAFVGRKVSEANAELATRGAA